MSTGVVFPFSARFFSSLSFAFAIASLHFVSDIVRAPYAKSGDRSRAGAANERGGRARGEGWERRGGGRGDVGASRSAASLPTLERAGSSA